jgi:hypothetical protein
MILELRIWIHSPSKGTDDPAISHRAGGEFGVRGISRMATFALGSLLLAILFMR